MGCHILDPVYTSLALTAPKSIRSDGGAPNGDNWGLDSKVRYLFPGTKHTTETLTLYWYDGDQRPPARDQVTDRQAATFGPGVDLYRRPGSLVRSLYRSRPCCCRPRSSRTSSSPIRAETTTTCNSSKPAVATAKPRRPFDYSGPLTESVLLGCLATRFPGMTLEWDPAELKVTNVSEANAFVRRRYRKGWEVEGL